MVLAWSKAGGPVCTEEQRVSTPTGQSGGAVVDIGCSPGRISRLRALPRNSNIGDSLSNGTIGTSLTGLGRLLLVLYLESLYALACGKLTAISIEPLAITCLLWVQFA